MRFLLLAASGIGVSCLLAGMLLDRPPDPSGPPLACPALAPRILTADRIELTQHGQVLWLERRGSIWGMARQGGYPVQQDRAAALLGPLLTTRLMTPAPAEPQDAASGTSVRVLGTSGATLCAIVAGPEPAKIIQRLGDTSRWVGSATIPGVSADPDAWSQHALPPLDPALVTAVVNDGGLGAQSVAQLLAALPFTDVRPRPQIHASPVRTLQLALNTGSAVLTVGVQAGQAWLLVSGTSAWARPLAPYAFALPSDSPLAGS